MSTGEKIKKARDLAGLTQKELAKRSGLAEITIRQYENGKREPKKEMIAKIAEALNISPITLVWGEDINNKWQDLLDDRDEAKDSATKTLTQLFSLIKKIIIENDIADIFTEIPEEDLLYCFWSLNKSGQEKAIELIGLLTEIKRYQKGKESI